MDDSRVGSCKDAERVEEMDPTSVGILDFLSNHVSSTMKCRVGRVPLPES